MEKRPILEEWRLAKGYENFYKVSSFGRVSSINYRNTGEEKILNQYENNKGYFYVVFSVGGKRKTKPIHQLVAEAFLNHTVCGYKLVVNHKDLNPKNNHKNNLELITQRENSNKKHLNLTSKYTGVSWDKATKKWRSQININRKVVYLGCYETEAEASDIYKKALNRHLQEAEKLLNKKIV